MIYRAVYYLILVSFCLNAVALTTTTSAHTKQQIEKITNEIHAVREELDQSKASREKYYNELASTEKKISANITQQHAINQQLQQSQHTIPLMQTQTQALEKKFTHRQQSLANLVRARFKLRQVRPWQWLLNQHSPQKINRRLAYHHYLLKANTQLIQETHNAQISLEKNLAALQQEQHQLKQLQHQLHTQEHQLLEFKQYQAQLLSKINQRIENKQQILADYRHDQAQLNHLLNRISNAISPPSVKTSQILPKLNQAFVNPLSQHALHAEPLKQGLIFYAAEGEQVKAILPGKVIFSDWLNGYGLLLIVDHGKGLMSLYAHNQALFKLKGMQVNAGDQIATVGHTGGLAKNGLYFELRRHGKVIPPGKWIA